jgi:multiple sugar transport system permease protein
MSTTETYVPSEHRLRISKRDAPSVPRSFRVTRQRIIISFIHAVLGLVFLLPMVWVVDAAFSPHASQTLTRPSFTLVNFRVAMSLGAGHAIENSLYLAIVSTAVATFVSVLAAYALSRRRVPLKGSLLVVILMLSGLPITLLLIPIYFVFIHLGWLNSPFYTSLALAASSVPFEIWLLKNFIDQVPKELEEAAAIEGSGGVRILWRVVVPLAMPGILVASIITFISSWGSFLLPFVLDSNPANTPASIGIYNNILANSQVSYGPLAAYAILFSIPVLLLYLISTRWLHGGFSFAGGVKG